MLYTTINQMTNLSIKRNVSKAPCRGQRFKYNNGNYKQAQLSLGTRSMYFKYTASHTVFACFHVCALQPGVLRRLGVP